ncbi:CMP-N-acetylneuraminate-beta-galactosamide-alpha-2,3-sialyltransferase 4 isoform X2 [Megalops cyprinoides]|uniref:CMP-N-acetylneuraminate-beta-galactosamide- alpha-2,3-sialyltransferase 4 isoform X2 n=1 Tax=Megalops cyprinoides TaxID=118141 RepID=UPI0018653849|nr:CMP-N-acetylneuraminate-beta-galactosamide-alpha-2,3-sialyltransferase 4 isoform X2 [Megalops cyprinoides]
MSLKIVKIWFIRVVPVVLFFISYYYTQFFLQSNAGTARSLTSSKTVCDSWMRSRRWESLNLNVTRKTSLFLKLADFFWQQPQSTLPLPYGIKGSELFLLKVLAVTASYEMPTSIEKLNNAPVRGYEDDVGNKTTMRLFYPESASYNPSLHNDPDTIMVLVPFKQHDLRWLKEILYDEKRVRKGFWKPPPQIWLGHTSQIRVLDPFFLKQTASALLRIPLQPKRNQRPVHPTTGILAVYMALNYCDVVHVAGFGYPKFRDQKQPIHYYGHETMKSMKDSNHDLPHEAEALKRLEDAGAILYLHPHS